MGMDRVLRWTLSYKHSSSRLFRNIPGIYTQISLSQGQGQGHSIRPRRSSIEKQKLRTTGSTLLKPRVLSVTFGFGLLFSSKMSWVRGEAMYRRGEGEDKEARKIEEEGKGIDTVTHAAMTCRKEGR